MSKRKIFAVRRRVSLENSDIDDLNYWLSKKPQERVAAVTKLIRQSMPKDLKLDRTAFSQRIKE